MFDLTSHRQTVLKVVSDKVLLAHGLKILHLVLIYKFHPDDEAGESYFYFVIGHFGFVFEMSVYAFCSF